MDPLRPRHPCGAWSWPSFASFLIFATIPGADESWGQVAFSELAEVGAVYTELTTVLGGQVLFFGPLLLVGALGRLPDQGWG